MYTSSFHRPITIAALCLIFLLVVGSAFAVEVTVPTGGSPLNVNPGTITFDTALTANVGDNLGFTFTVNSGVLGTPFYTGVNVLHGLGQTAAGLFNTQGSSLDLANGVANGGVAPRTGARASWSNRRLINLPGDDFVATENGSAGGNEYYVIRVKPVNGAVSNYYYSPADAFQDSNTVDNGTVGIIGDEGDFLTAFDLSDLGYADCTRFEYVEFWEMLTTDTFNSTGYGYVGAGSTPPFRPPILDQVPPAFQSQFYDADIGFIFAVSAGHLEPVIPQFEITSTDTSSGILFSDPCVEVAEGTTVGDQFAFRLGSQPSANVDVTFTVSNSAQIRIDDGSVAGLTFVNSFTATFTPATWDQWVIVNVQALEDNTPEANPHTASIAISSVSADAAFNGLSTSETVFIYEPGFAFTEQVPNPIQEGGSGTYTVVITAPPGQATASTLETVRINLSGFNIRFLNPPTPTPLFFTRANWRTPQTINVVTVDDTRDYGNLYNTTITHGSATTATSPYDSRYGGAGSNIASERFRITIADNDLTAGSPLSDAQYEALVLAAWLDLAASSAPLVEGESSAALGVRLAGQPAEGEVVEVVLSSAPDVALYPTVLYFNEFNWNSYQMVTLTPALNSVEQGTYTVPVQAVVSGATTMFQVVGASDAVVVTVVDGSAGAAPAELPLQTESVDEGETPSSAEGTQSE
jgi:hypothetical protein